jgi:hypothetical protein
MKEHVAKNQGEKEQEHYVGNGKAIAGILIRHCRRVSIGRGVSTESGHCECDEKGLYNKASKSFDGGGGGVVAAAQS